MGFDHQKIEAKWQKYWDENQTFKTDVWDFHPNTFATWLRFFDDQIP